MKQNQEDCNFGPTLCTTGTTTIFYHSCVGGGDTVSPDVKIIENRKDLISYTNQFMLFQMKKYVINDKWYKQAGNVSVHCYLSGDDYTSLSILYWIYKYFYCRSKCVKVKRSIILADRKKFAWDIFCFWRILAFVPHKFQFFSIWRCCWFSK